MHLIGSPDFSSDPKCRAAPARHTLSHMDGCRIPNSRRRTRVASFEAVMPRRAVRISSRKRVSNPTELLDLTVSTESRNISRPAFASIRAARVRRRGRGCPLAGARGANVRDALETLRPGTACSDKYRTKPHRDSRHGGRAAYRAGDREENETLFQNRSRLSDSRATDCGITSAGARESTSTCRR